MLDKEHGNIICDECGGYTIGGGICITDEVVICLQCIEELFFEYCKPKIKKEMIILRTVIQEKDRDAILKRDGYECVKCGSKEKLEIDHIKPWRWGGVTKRKNFQTLCKSCNNKKCDT